MKARGLWIFTSALVLSGIFLCWFLFTGQVTEDTIRLGWYMNLYQLPLVNAIFLPLMSMVVASRLCGAEHRGHMLKALCAMEKKAAVYDAKLVYGLAVVILCDIIIWAVIIAYGFIIGYKGPFPAKLYAMTIIFTLVPTAVIYIFQHTLSLVFRNQAAAFFSGVIGEFAGIFSLFLPNIPILRKMLIWGWYGALQLVGLYGWNKETRFQYAYFETMPIDGLFLAAVFFSGAAIYAVGKYVFVKKEV